MVLVQGILHPSRCAADERLDLLLGHLPQDFLTGGRTTTSGFLFFAITTDTTEEG